VIVGIKSNSVAAEDVRVNAIPVVVFCILEQWSEIAMQMECITTKFMGILLFICFKRFVLLKTSCWFKVKSCKKFSQLDPWAMIGFLISMFRISLDAQLQAEGQVIPLLNLSTMS
jgi:hypothetical protein